MRAGARGYLLKGASGDETLRAVRAVANGEVIFSPGVAQQITHYFARGVKPAPDAPFPELTPREIETLDLVAQGLTYGRRLESRPGFEMRPISVRT